MPYLQHQCLTHNIKALLCNDLIQIKRRRLVIQTIQKISFESYIQS